MSLQEYMRSEGIDLNGPKEKVSDPYLLSRRQPLHAYVTPSEYDKLKQFLELDRKVLRFYCVWDDRDSMFGEMKQHVRSHDVYTLLSRVKSGVNSGASLKRK